MRAAKHAVDALRCAEDEDEVSCLDADLVTEAAAGHLDEAGRLPLAIGVANQQDAAAVLHAEDECPAEHAGEDRDALGIREHRRRDLGLWHLHRLREDGGRVDDGYFRRVLSRGRSTERESAPIGWPLRTGPQQPLLRTKLRRFIMPLVQ